MPLTASAAPKIGFTAELGASVYHQADPDESGIMNESAAAHGNMLPLLPRSGSAATGTGSYFYLKAEESHGGRGNDDLCR
jgi:hypothetical protein